MAMLQGKKTYIVAGATAAAAVAHALGYVDDPTYQMLLGLLGASGAATLAAKINRQSNGAA